MVYVNKELFFLLRNGRLIEFELLIYMNKLLYDLIFLGKENFNILFDSLEIEIEIF